MPRDLVELNIEQPTTYVINSINARIASLRREVEDINSRSWLNNKSNAYLNLLMYCHCCCCFTGIIRAVTAEKEKREKATISADEYDAIQHFVRALNLPQESDIGFFAQYAGHPKEKALAYTLFCLRNCLTNEKVQVLRPLLVTLINTLSTVRGIDLTHDEGIRAEI